MIGGGPPGLFGITGGLIGGGPLITGGLIDGGPPITGGRIGGGPPITGGLIGGGPPIVGGLIGGGPPIVGGLIDGLPLIEGGFGGPTAFKIGGGAILLLSPRIGGGCIKNDASEGAGFDKRDEDDADDWAVMEVPEDDVDRVDFASTPESKSSNLGFPPELKC